MTAWSERARRRLALLPVFIAVTVMTCWAVWQGSALMRADFASMAARQKVEQWARAGRGWTAPEWKSARSDLQAALQITPDDPVLHDALAQLYVTQGIVGWADPEQRAAYFEEALEHQQASLKLRPGDGSAWANLAVSLWVLKRPLPDMQSAWLQASRYAPREWPVQQALVDLALATWDQATPQMRLWVMRCWQEALPEQRAVMLANATRRGRAQVLQP